MNKIKILNFIIIIFFITINANSEIDEFSISFVIGNFKTFRNGKIIKLKLGDIVKKGDIFKIYKSSLVEFKTENLKIRIKGYNIFKFDRNKIKTCLKRDSILNNLFYKITKDSYHYIPKKIVTAVRGKDDYEKNRKLNRFYESEMRKAISLYKKGNIDEASIIMNKIDRIEGIKKIAKVIIKFYKAEILFNKMDFRKALELYSEIYKYKSYNFKQREEAHVRAIICSDYINNYDLKNKLIIEYKESYGEKGKYRKYID